MDTNFSMPGQQEYHSLYKYINILTDTQIRRLRNIAIGLLKPSDFSAEEIQELEKKSANGDLPPVQVKP